MCLECVPQLEPPTPELAQGRLFLQLLAAGLFIVSLFAMLAGEAFTIFFMLILAFILYLSWSDFSYSMTLNFFLICVLQVIMVYVEVIRVIQYFDQISSKNAGFVLYLIVRVVYFPNAVFFSHEAYKKFKQYAYTYADAQSFGDYQMMPIAAQSQLQSSHNQYPRQDYQPAAAKKFTPFSGESITIG